MKSDVRTFNDKITPVVLGVIRKYMSHKGSLPVYSISSPKVIFLFLRLCGYILRLDLQLKGTPQL